MSAYLLQLKNLFILANNQLSWGVQRHQQRYKLRNTNKTSFENFTIILSRMGIVFEEYFPLN